MFKNYLKVAFRNLLKHKGYSFINIAGLAVGMACSILMLLWVQDELTYDMFHAKGERIYKVMENQGSVKQLGLLRFVKKTKRV